MTQKSLMAMQDAPTLVKQSELAPIIDIIIPVYKGIKETRRCLESVLAFPQETTHEIIVINDASPEPEISTYLRELVELGLITLLDNPVNTGFVNAVNRGMVQHQDRDIVLLNSDTEVHGNWLDRLHSHAQSDPLVSTVTPFSNNATICSYPRFQEMNALPADESLASLDNLFSTIHQDRSVEIPTAVGFCVYITRRSINQVGYFNATLFGKGYGEENDFSMRGMELGFHHLIAADTFVYHQGAVSFVEQSAELCAKAQVVLEQEHPTYKQLIENFALRDPLRPLRRHIDLVRLSQSRRRRILFITHSWGGGIEKHIQELAQLLKDDNEILILRPIKLSKIKLEWCRAGEEFTIYFSLPYDYKSLVSLIKKLQIAYLHYHHVLGLPQQVFYLANALGVPYDFTLHDYYSICPQYSLTDQDGRYCGEPDNAGCNACLVKRPALWGMDIQAWRDFFQNLLRGAQRVIVPSQDALLRMQKYVPHAHYVLLPHPERMEFNQQNKTLIAGNKLKILVLGKISLIKGLKLLEACAVDAQVRNLPLLFRVIGFCEEQVIQEPAAPLSFSGNYDDANLPELIVMEQADLVFFPALWPETYSYTLSYAMRSGLPIAAPRLGAFPERLAEYPLAWLRNWDSSAQSWNDFFIAVLSTNRSRFIKTTLG